MPLDPRLQVALAALPAREPTTASPAERRAEAVARAKQGEGVLSAVVPPLPDERDLVVPTEAGGVPIRVYRPRPGRLPAFVFIHGGGWWLGGLDESNGMCRRRAASVPCVVISIDYRLAPEHPFPAAVDDSFAAVQWIVDNADELDIDPDRIAIGGGSAGGNIAAAVTQRLRDETSIKLVGQLLEVAATDLTLTTSEGSANEFAEGYGLSKADLYECVEFYLGDQDAKNPLASPLLGELHDLPPALITTAECDPVRDDGEAYAAKLADAGVPVTLKRWEGQVHGSMEADVVLPDVAEAYRAEVTNFLRAVFTRG